MKVREPQGSLGHLCKTWDLETNRKWIDQFNLKTKLKDHQLRSVCLAMKTKSWLFALDMGLGKTLISLTIFDILKKRNKAKRMLVLCPPIVQDHWENEIKKHTDLSFCNVKGNFGEKYDGIVKNKKDVTIVSMNWLPIFIKSSDFKGKEWFSKNWDVLVIDECHKVKNATTKVFQSLINRVLDIDYRYLLSGTPIGNDYLGVFGLLYLIDKGETFGTDYDKFLSEYFNVFVVSYRYKRYSIKKEIEEDFINEFWKKAVRWEETDCNDLPEKIYTSVPVEPSAKWFRDYIKLLQNELQEDNKESKSNNIFNLMRYTGGLLTKENPKLDSLLDIVEMVCIDTGSKLIIWHWMVAEGEMILKAINSKYKKLKVACINGSISANNKKLSLHRWKNNKLDIIVANPDSLGVGVDLYEANYCCYFSNPLSIVKRKQSEKRIHRTGQTKTCFYYDLYVKNTIDTRILSILMKVDENFNNFMKDNNTLINKLFENMALDIPS